jgi:hypothetical protein
LSFQKFYRAKSNSVQQIIINMAKPKNRNTTGDVPIHGSSQMASSVVQNSSKHADYTSEGVEDHDVFLLPASDYQVVLLVALVAAVVRLFRIYQPSSVVFDEVQYVALLNLLDEQSANYHFLVLAVSRRNTSKANFSWMSTLPWQSSS